MTPSATEGKPRASVSESRFGSIVKSGPAGRRTDACSVSALRKSLSTERERLAVETKQGRESVPVLAGACAHCEGYGAHARSEHVGRWKGRSWGVAWHCLVAADTEQERSGSLVARA
jgi:hypothetical protein